MNQYEDKVALITGSGRGIGRAIALRLAAEGADIVVNFFRNRKPAEQTADEIRELGRRAIVVKANVGNLDELNTLFDSAESEYGKLDFFIHNAASGYNRPVLKQKPRGWEWTMNINARPLLFGAQRASELMPKRERSAIVALTSMGSVRVVPDYVAVGASKATLEALVRYLGVELAPLNISVNAVSPGLVITDALQHFAVFDEAGQEIIEKTREKTPIGRLCRPEDVADLVSFLCSERAAMVCGQTIVMDGGFSLLASA